jgi:indole-3-glycerol phosphate synthase
MILDDIVKDKLQEIEERKQRLPEAELLKLIARQAPAIDFAGALRGYGIKLIAEVKKASPSRGVIRADFDPVSLAGIYAENGAAAISILTDGKYFQGSLDYLKEIRQSLGDTAIPLLRKDFILDPYQVYESRAYGADALLLIVAILTPARLKQLLILGHQLGMRSLVEVHNRAEVEIALNAGAGIIGINNRDLTTFEVDIHTTERLCHFIPLDRLVVSESGIKSRKDIEQLQRLGVHAALVGETLVAAPDVATKMKELLGQD